jgi:hypothetical protein
MASLVLGPLLRWVGDTAATVWVETDTACTVELILTDAGAGGDGGLPGGGRAVRKSEPTFHVLGHHYALVVIEGLEPGRSYPYSVELDGEQVWPRAGDTLPPSVVRTLDPSESLRIAFGSCRKAVPNEPPWTLPTSKDRKRGHGLDALAAYAERMLVLPRPQWPDCLLLLGDQVYADDTPPRFQEYARTRRDTSKPPGLGVADFEEYTFLYREAWAQLPIVRWLLSTVPSAMIFDDHDVHDDWNTSEAWVQMMRAKDWWQDRIVGGLMSYWLYQHIGNLAPRNLAKDELFNKIRAEREGSEALAAFADKADKAPEGDGTQWSYSREWGRTRLLVIDSRCGRVLQGERRDMLDEHEWDWLDERITGDVDHLLLATSLPYLLPPAISGLEGWDEAVAAGVWGRRLTGFGEYLRQLGDLEHWAAFRSSFERLAGMVAAAGSGRRGEPPASIVFLSGDVHNAYLAEATFPASEGVRSRVWQAVCSPLRNPAERSLELANRVANSPVGSAIGRVLALSGRVPKAPMRWRVTKGPFFDNQIATIELAGRGARAKLEEPYAPDGTDPVLRTLMDEPLTAEAARPGATGVSPGSGEPAQSTP